MAESERKGTNQSNGIASWFESNRGGAGGYSMYHLI